MFRISVSFTPLNADSYWESRLEHILQDCPEYPDLWKKWWAMDVNLNYRLYRTKEELQIAAVRNKNGGVINKKLSHHHMVRFRKNGGVIITS